MDKIRPNALFYVAVGSISLPAPAIATPPAFGPEAIFFGFFIGTTTFTILAVVAIISSFFLTRTQRRKCWIVASLLLLAGPAIDLMRKMENRNFYATINEVHEKRKNLPITAKMKEKIKRYVTIQKADMWINDDGMTVSQRLVMQLDVKKAGKYVIWQGGGSIITSMKEGANIVEIESHNIVNEDLTSWLKVQYMATAREVFGDSYPNHPVGGDLDLDVPIYFTVMPDTKIPVTVHRTQSPGMPNDQELWPIPNK